MLVTSQQKTNKQTDMDLLRDIEKQFIKTVEFNEEFIKAKIDLLRKNNDSKVRFKIKIPKSKTMLHIPNKYEEKKKLIENEEQEQQLSTTRFKKQESPNMRKTMQFQYKHGGQKLMSYKQQTIKLVKSQKESRQKAFKMDQKFGFQAQSPQLKRQKGSILNKNALFLIPYLKNKLKSIHYELNYPHIGQIPILKKKISLNKLEHQKMTNKNSLLTRNYLKQMKSKFDPFKMDLTPW